MIYFPTNGGAKEPQNLRNHRVEVHGANHSGQFTATFPAGWSPQKVVNSKGIPP